MNKPSSNSHLQIAKSPRVAIVHDWLVGGGAERVVLELHRMYPDAPIYTSYATDEWRERLDGKVVTGWLQHFGKLRKFMVLGRIWWFTHLDLSDYDLVISSSGNGEAKSVKTKSETTHVCYCHAPVHYYWRHYDQYLAHPGFGAFDWLARIGLRILVGPLRWWDKNRASKRPNFYIANSTHTANEIKEFYGRDSVVIQPPVDITSFANAKKPDTPAGFVTLGRQTSYKKVDLIIEACNRLSLPLTVIGNGPEHDKLVALAGPTITFRTDVTDSEKPELVAKHSAFIFAAFEDFGIAPVEALAAGTPLIAYKAGGALDYVDDTTGVYFASQSAEALVEALKQFQPAKYDAKKLQEKAAEFSPEQFQQKLRAFLERLPESVKE